MTTPANRKWTLRSLIVMTMLALALVGGAGSALADEETDTGGNNTQCNTNNGITVCTPDDADDTVDEGDDTGGSNNGGNNNDGDGIVNS